MDDVLAKYREGLKKRADRDVPKFAPEAVHTAPILALLEEPDNSGAAQSLIVQVHNDDPTARRTLKMIKKVGLELNDYVLWNFYASLKAKTILGRRSFWEEETQTLANLMPNLKVVLAFGNETWLGMQHVELPKRVVLFGAPHPSNRGVINKLAEGKIERAWARAKQLIDGCEK